jgi:hypothetical protein
VSIRCGPTSAARTTSSWLGIGGMPGPGVTTVSLAAGTSSLAPPTVVEKHRLPGVDGARASGS